MDNSQPSKHSLQETVPQTNHRKILTPSASPPNITFRHSPSPDALQSHYKQHNSSLLQSFPEHSNHSDQYTPIALSPSAGFSAPNHNDLEPLIVEHRLEV